MGSESESVSREVAPVASKRSAVIDVVVVGGMSLLYVGMEAADVAKRWSFALVAVTLAVYAVYLVRSRTHTLRSLGFRRDNLRAGAFPVASCTAFAAGGVVVWALARDEALWSRDVLLLLALYPVWAVVQQLAFQGLLHRGFMALVPIPALQVLGTAGAFACVHAGNSLLVALTFVAGLGWSLLYRRWPNLWLLAASHTLLAALAYPLVLADAPLSRV